jgi:hypothetical protein
VLKDFSITPEMLIYGIRREKDCTIFHLSCEDYKCIVGYYEGKWNPVQYFPTYQSALDEAIAQAQDRLAKLQALNTENHG